MIVKNKKLAAGILILGFGTSTMVQASYPFFVQQNYVGATFNYSIPSATSGMTNTSKTPYGFGAYGGHRYPISQVTYFGWEVGADYYGQSKFTYNGKSQSASLYQLQALATGWLFFLPNYEVHAKAGVGYQYDPISGGDHATSHGIVGVIGLGAGYYLSNQTQLTFDIQHTFAGSSGLTSSSGASAIDSVKLGLSYSF